MFWLDPEPFLTDLWRVVDRGVKVEWAPYVCFAWGVIWDRAGPVEIGRETYKRRYIQLDREIKTRKQRQGQAAENELTSEVIRHVEYRIKEKEQYNLINNAAVMLRAAM